MIHLGDLFTVLPTLKAESFDACVTDPPYGIGYQGKKWDTFSPDGERFAAMRLLKNKQIKSTNPNLRGRRRAPAVSPSQIQYDFSLAGLRGFQSWSEQWAAEMLRVLKPGAYIVVHGAPRSYHRMAAGIEDAGFEIRDCFAWLFGQGFPKSLNLGDGLGTALKPAYEPIVIARKPFKGSVKANIEKHGTAALNIDACRIEAQVVPGGGFRTGPTGGNPHAMGRWPSNVLLDEIAAGMVGDVARFYYVAKPSRRQRDRGCRDLPAIGGGEATERKEGSAGLRSPRAGAGRTGGSHNQHPTIKPVELMRWLVRLVTPPGGHVLDPFLGSGTTGMACRFEGRKFTGIEREAQYVEIARRRIASVRDRSKRSA